MKQKNEKPEWVKAAEKWQEESNEARSILIIASDRDGMTNAIVGMPLVLINSIFQNLKYSPKFVQLIKDAQMIKKGGIAEYLFAEKFTEYAKENGIEVRDANPLEELHSFLGNLLNKDDE